MIRAAIFDLDGLLIDSEPLWTRAEIEVFATVGIRLDQEDCGRTVGMGLEEVVAFRYGQKPWSSRSREEVAGDIHRRVAELIAEQGRPLPGAGEAVALARRMGAKVGLATSSDDRLIQAALQAIGLSGAFDHLQSAAELSHGKPHPEVYLLAAAGLGVAPGQCLALEDSIPGLIAAKAARMKAVAVPERRQAGDPRLAIADEVLGSLLELDERVWSSLAGQDAKDMSR